MLFLEELNAFVDFVPFAGASVCVLLAFGGKGVKLAFKKAFDNVEDSLAGGLRVQFQLQDVLVKVLGVDAASVCGGFLLQGVNIFKVRSLSHKADFFGESLLVFLEVDGLVDGFNRL